MKYRCFFVILSCLSLFSCSMEKQLYSPGYHVDWFHSPYNSREIEIEKNTLYSPVLSASSSAEPIVSQENILIEATEQRVLKPDTVIPNRTTESEDDYVTPNNINEEIRRPFDPQNINLTERDYSTLSKLSQYLVFSAFATMIPGLTILYPLVFIVNIFVIRKIKALAHLSPNEAYYLNQIKRYWRTIIWPLYALALGLLLFLLFAGLALLA
jgi:hypothetical protein